MELKELLLTKRWITKLDDRDAYYAIKDHAKEYRKFFQEKFGYSLIVHQHYIRLDKVPDKAEPWMGITAFKHIEEYQYFCLVLIYLEDKQIEEQFILSSLLEFMIMQMQADEGYWLNYQHRRHFVNVLRYCIQEKLMIQDDGDSDAFLNQENTEVLFENTGLSRYFMRTFISDIFSWNQPEDFMKNEWFDDMQDRGLPRRQRIYRQLLLSNGIYYENEESQDTIASYIRNYRRRIEKDMEWIAPCDLQVYNSSAYLIFDEDHQFGTIFPKSNALDELTSVCLTDLYKKAKKTKQILDRFEVAHFPIESLKDIVKRTIQANFSYLPATYRQKEVKEICNLVVNRMIEIGFIQEKEDEYICYPVIGKLMSEFEKGEVA